MTAVQCLMENAMYARINAAGKTIVICHFSMKQNGWKKKEKLI